MRGFLLCCVGGALGLDVILPPSAPRRGGDVALLIAPAANASFVPAQYAQLGRATQRAARATAVWVGVIDVAASSTADPSVFARGAARALAALVDAGMDADAPVIAAGHGDGGAMVEAHAFARASAPALAGIALLGSFIPRAHYARAASGAAVTPSSTEGYYPVATLTVAGELDGVCRLPRAAAEPYFQQIALAGDAAAAARRFPVVAIAGASHAQFANGSCASQATLRKDLRPEAADADATAAIAAALGAFVDATAAGDAAAGDALAAAVDATRALVSPLLLAMETDGYRHLRPPCESDFPTNSECGYPKWPDSALPPGPQPPPDPLPPADCACGSSWVMAAAQTLMAGLDGSVTPAATVDCRDSFHDVSDTHPFHLPHIFNACEAGAAECALNVTTVSMPVYEDADDADGGYAPVSAVEYRTKLKSREAMWDAVGGDVAHTDDTDATAFNLCAQINQAALDWALARAGAAALSRYERVGEPLVIADDLEAPIGATGPTWIAKRLKYDRAPAAGGGTQVNVTSWSFTVANYGGGDVPYWITAGYHYCKLLPLSRAMEWVYVDSLRARGAAASSADVAARCEACLEKKDPLHLSASSAWCWIDEACYAVGDTSNPCTETQCASGAALSSCICDSCDALTCSM